jgi:large subunit ribosomal protein L20
MLKKAKGFRYRNNLYKNCKEAILNSLKFASAHRRKKKGDFRSLWIVRLNAAIRELDPNFNYSRFVNGLKKANVLVDRKQLADLAAQNAPEFAKLFEIAKAAV